MSFIAPPVALTKPLVPNRRTWRIGLPKRGLVHIGNLDARHNLCHGTPETIAAEVVQCLDYGRRTRGGHILHASHSVHEDMPVAAYRRYFGLEKLPD